MTNFLGLAAYMIACLLCALTAASGLGLIATTAVDVHYWRRHGHTLTARNAILAPLLGALIFGCGMGGLLMLIALTIGGAA